MPPAVDPSQLAQDKDFSAAGPDDQIKYLSAQDPDFAKASHEDQMGYLEHLTGKPAAPNAGLAPAAGAPPPREQSAKTMDSGEGPIARNMTSFETQLSGAPAGLGRMAVAKRWPIVDAKNWSELGQDVESLNPIVKTDTGETGGVDIGATAANLLPFAVGMKKFGEALPSATRAGETLEGVSSQMRGTPVNAGPIDQAAIDALTQHEHGAGALPPPIRKYIKYAGGPGGMRSFPGSTNIPFEDARDFQSNSGRLSGKDLKAMSPKMKRELGNFAARTAEANQAAAEAGGQGEPYRQGLNEYRRAMQMRQFGKNVAKTAIPLAVGAGGYGLMRRYAPRMIP